ncbi:hypothetical protein [Parafrankia elaeagni]|uniref:hypothetical protein n=1 Tax=Parafrankia elaeagni TaxID=222534 RepID=UPI0003A019BF|nr:hypothetical protein [Parafrankia elaeagni]
MPAVPPLFVHRTIARMRAAASPPAGARLTVLTEAARRFATATLGDLSVEEYQRMVSRVGGLPISTVRAATEAIAEWLARAGDSIGRACPVGTAIDWRDPSTRSGRSGPGAARCSPTSRPGCRACPQRMTRRLFPSSRWAARGPSGRTWPARPLTVMTQDARIVDHLLNEPTIRNLYLGDHPTVWMAAGVPHDGYLADFLMENKALVRD